MAIDIFCQRRKHLIKQLVAVGVDAVFICKKENIYFFSGLASLHPLEREAFLIITYNQSVLYHSPFVSLTLKSEKLKLIPMSRDYPVSACLKDCLRDGDEIGIESDNLTVAEEGLLKKCLVNSKLEPIDSLIADLRMIKDNQEIKFINQAGIITNKVMGWVKNYCALEVDSKVSEKKLGQLIMIKAFELGADDLAFPTVVAFNQNSASPHHVAGNDRLTNNSVVLIDMGVKVANYLSDMTRTFWVGNKPSQDFIKISKLVKKAYRAGKNILLSGHKAKRVDEVVRNVITKAGYGEYFIHSSGHGIGLSAHEAPSINNKNDTILKANMAITLEPGIYLPHRFGVRLENTLVIQ